MLTSQFAGVEALSEGSDVRQVYEHYERMRAENAKQADENEPQNNAMGFTATCLCGRSIWSWAPRRKCDDCEAAR